MLSGSQGLNTFLISYDGTLDFMLIRKNMHLCQKVAKRSLRGPEVLG